MRVEKRQDELVGLLVLAMAAIVMFREGVVGGAREPGTRLQESIDI
jgi:hypothetical protein